MASHRVSTEEVTWYPIPPVGRVIDIYGGEDAPHPPPYSTAEAAHYLRLPRATLKAWVHGRVDSNGHRAEAVIKLPTNFHLLSFQNLVEAHVLGAIRRHHGVSLQRVRKALRFVERRMHLPRPLIEAKFPVVAPLLSFGRPVFAKTGVPVSIIVGRYRAGEDVSAIAKDYGISVDQTHDAIRTAIPAAA